MVNRETLKYTLQHCAVNVEFRKADCTVRKMLCTLHPDHAVFPETPKAGDIQARKIRHVNPEVQPVFDLEKKAWRSFRYDSVIRYSIEWVI
jgi:hypothetical protein